MNVKLNLDVKKSHQADNKTEKCHCELHTMGKECFLDIFMTKIFNFTLRTYNNSFAVQNIRELKQPRRRRQRKTYKFAYLTMKNSIFALFARAYFIFWHFEDVLVLSMTWNDLFCSCVDDVSIWWWQMLIFVLCPKHWFQFNSRIVRTHFSSIMTLSNWKTIAEPRSYNFRWRSRFRRRRVCLSSLMWLWSLVSISLYLSCLSYEKKFIGQI